MLFYGMSHLISARYGVAGFECYFHLLNGVHRVHLLIIMNLKSVGCSTDDNGGLGDIPVVPQSTGVVSVVVRLTIVI